LKNNEFLSYSVARVETGIAKLKKEIEGEKVVDFSIFSHD